jgi:DtxR family Mn-dependent transcriptional regulator
MRDRGRLKNVEDGYHPPLEEYLETILGLEEEGTPVIQARIAERLGRSAPAVSEMLGRLEADGFIAREGRAISLALSGTRCTTKPVAGST